MTFFKNLDQGNPGQDLIQRVYAADAPRFWSDASRAVVDLDSPALNNLWIRLTKNRDDGDALWRTLNNLAGQRLPSVDKAAKAVIPDHAGTLALLIATAARIALSFDPTKADNALRVTELDRFLDGLNAATGNKSPLADPQFAPGTHWPDYLRERMWTITVPGIPNAQFALWDAVSQLWQARFPKWSPALRRHHVCCVPVAGVRDDDGFVATLELEALDRSESELGAAFPDKPAAHFHDPAQWLVVATDSRFRASMTDAWSLAYEDFRATNKNRPHVGRWRLYEGWVPDDRVHRDACRIANGPSAGGAALRGWRFALTAKFPPPEVVMIAAVEPKRGYAGLGAGIDVKVRHIAEAHAGDFDTVAVATPEDARIALEAVGKSGLRVVIVGDRKLAIAQKEGDSLKLSDYLPFPPR